ncbi:hypothetical protein HCN44_011036 [Aphidius gifuensis]|uniref:Transposable element P transposase-like GTP-binding insertion domain-containing protein n=1 Tax=Aphidius gifuensis TaxID=684658 RepID=A0A835CYM4_APHGI|nr:hypothetical protein HCN44_011036 [Aphidius gifuensis]
MPRACCIKGCLTGHTRNPHPYFKCAIFDIPKELSMRQQWLATILPHIQGRKSRKENHTPDGKIKKKHWKAVIELDGGKENFGSKAAHKLTADHIDPQYWQKMNVAMAFKVFSERVLAVMIMNKATHPDLHDCDPTTNFIKRIRKVITAMTSRNIKNSLEYGNEHYNVLLDFREYMLQWKSMANKNNCKFLSDST